MTLDEAFMIAAAIDPSAMQVAIQDYMNCSGILPKDPGAAQTELGILWWRLRPGEY